MTISSLAQCLEGTSHIIGDQTFLMFDDLTMTFSEFDARASRLANVFAAHGAKAGDVIGLYLPSRPELAFGYWACQKLGAVAAPVSSMNRSREVGAAVSRTEMKRIFVNEETLPFALEVQRDSGRPETIFVTGGRPRARWMLTPSLQRPIRFAPLLHLLPLLRLRGLWQ